MGITVVRRPFEGNLSHAEVRRLLMERGAMEEDEFGNAHVDLREAMEIPEFRALFETLIGPFLGWW